MAREGADIILNQPHSKLEDTTVEKKRVLVCSAWPYASGIPHLGNLVGCLLSGDVFARYYRMRGADVLYVSGTDAHGTRIQYEAQKAGVTPEELAAANHERICAINEAFGIQFDNYTTTMTDTHKTFVQEIYLQMESNGYIFTQSEQRAYCLHDQLFLADRLISGTCPKCQSPHALGNQCDSCGSVLEPEELINPVCCFCGKSEIEFRDTTHWYLDLAKLSPALSDYVASRDFQGNVRLFTTRMIDEGLRPRAMTRDIEWGIPAPFDGAEGKVIYVWGEAALGYVSSVIEHVSGDERWKDFWFGDDVFQIYTLAKDNIPFHTLIFPGQLLASQQGYHLPDQIAATEYLNWIGGDSFSKSRGVGLYCDRALELMDGDLWRFYLLYNRPEGRDVNFSWEELEKAINGILISNVANLINRVISFIQTQFDRVVPDVTLDSEVTEQVAKTVSLCESAFDRAVVGEGLRAVCDLAVFGNEYFQRKAPWDSKDPSVVASALHLVKALAVQLMPFVPAFASDVLEVLGIDDPAWADIDRSLGGEKLGEGRVLLERIEIEALRAAVPDAPAAARQAEAAPTKPAISFDDFQKLDLRIGEIIEANPVEGADKLLQLSVSFGDHARTCVAGIRESYDAGDVLGKRVVALLNLEPRRIRGVLSECMLLAAKDDRLWLTSPDGDAKLGSAVS